MKNFASINLDDQSGDLYYTLCNVAGAMLQGQTVTFLGKTVTGNVARKEGIKLVGLINEFDELMSKDKN